MSCIALLPAGDLGAIAFLLAVVTLIALYGRDARRERHARTSLFEPCLDLFQSVCVTQRRGDYPLLVGRYRDHDVRLEPLLDATAWRKLPSLWLKVTLLEPDPSCVVIDLLMRPIGNEFFSPAADLPRRLPIPVGWPREAILCADDGPVPDLDRLTPIAPLFDDPRMKELVITPAGIRLVYQLAQAERPYYAVLRQVRFARRVLDAATARYLLDAVLAVMRATPPVERRAA